MARTAALTSVAGHVAAAGLGWGLFSFPSLYSLNLLQGPLLPMGLY